MKFSFTHHSKVGFLLPLILVSVLLGGCSNTKYLAPGQKLYIGADLEVKSPKEIPDKSELQTELEEVIRPDPNFSIFGLRPTLWIYNVMGGEDQHRKVPRWIRDKIGEPPVLIQTVNPEKNVLLIENRLHNRGYFRPDVQFEQKEKEKKVSIDYVAEVVEPYRIKSVTWPTGDTLLSRAISQTQEETLIQLGEPYYLAELRAERERIDLNLKNRGYFYFNPDFIIFEVDSTIGSREVNIYVKVKPETPALARVPYTINNIIIDTDFSIGHDSLDMEEAVRVGKFYYFPDEKTFRARSILNSVFLEHGELYNREDHLLTLSRLMGLNVFQYVNARFTLADTLPANRLDAHLFLTPSLKKSLRVEVQGVTKSTGFIGPGINVNFRNRNALGGAELLTVGFKGSYETQLTPQNEGQRLTSWEFGGNAELQVPRFMVPFRLPNLRSEFVPRTRFNLGFNLLNRVQYFRMNSYNAGYGYIYRPRRFITHEVTLVNLQYVHVTDSTTAFTERLAGNPFLRRTFQDQFIIGSIYNFLYNTQVLGERKHHFFLNFNLDVSGNLASLIGSATSSEPNSPDQPYTLFGSTFSQYSRGEMDFRYYFKPGEESTLAFRLMGGAGLPYGNSSAMPYFKQFSIGGPNSIRAFRARSLGPGPYQAATAGGFAFFDQTGEIKLETNLEYRFGIIPYLKGAVFVDAGNIWMTGRQSSDNRGGVFRSATFLNEMAVGTGFGLRVDAQFFVLRFDLGIPVRVPYFPVGERTVIDDIAPGSPEWRRENLVLNIAVGYPF